MNRTTIETCLNPDGTPGYSFNPVTGCLNGCTYCYARKSANGRLANLYRRNKNLATQYHNIKALDDPFWPRFWPEQLADVQYCRTGQGTKPRGIFACSMSDLFGRGVPESWTQAVMDAIRADTIDRFYILTKQSQRLEKFSPFPKNCWVGVSCENEFDLFRHSSSLGNIEAKIRYISFEPLLRWRGLDRLVEVLNNVARVQWVIIGAVTKCPNLPQPEPAWIEEIVRSCDQAGVKVWLKSSLLPVLKFGPISYPWAFVNGQLRKEIP